MTTKTADVLLEAVGAALVATNRALETRATASPSTRQAASGDVLEALVALACAACDAVARWEESEQEPEVRDPDALPSRVTRWRGEIDDLRVQVALAQMELRDSRHHGLAAVAHSAGAVEKVLAGSVCDVGVALGAFRTALRPRG